MKITIRADEGKWLTDGETFGKTISLADGADMEKFYEITDGEYEKIQREKEEKIVKMIDSNI